MGAFNKKRQFGGKSSFGDGGTQFNRKAFGKKKFNHQSSNGKPGMHAATCSDCGKACEVPFRPTGNRAIYCSSCFEHQDNNKRPSSFRQNTYRDKPRHEDRPLHDATCATCKDDCQVPFRPTPGKPVYCNNCFDKGASTGSKGGADYSEHFVLLNKKLDTLIDLLTSKTVAAEILEKRSPKKVVTPKTKPATKVKTTTKKLPKTKSPAKKVTKKK